MAALLDFVLFRRHALPACPDLGCVDQPDTIDIARNVVRHGRRRRLAGAWNLGADGRLVCTWSAKPDDPA